MKTLRRLPAFLICFCLDAVGAAPVAAQESPAVNASASIGGANVSVRYAAPSVRGRQIFGSGGLVSRDRTYPAWRAGANAATMFETSRDLNIGGLHVPKGSYTLFAWVQDPNNWKLIINRQTGQWGLTYDAARDLGRVDMAMSKPPKPIETLRYTLTDKGAGAGELRLEWENHVATVPITVK